MNIINNTIKINSQTDIHNRYRGENKTKAFQKEKRVHTRFILTSQRDRERKRKRVYLHYRVPQ